MEKTIQQNEQFSFRRLVDEVVMGLKSKPILALIVMILASVTIDQVSKLHAERTLMVWSHETNADEYRGRAFPIKDFGDPHSLGTYLSFNFNYVRNQGAAWGALANVDDHIRVPFFYGVTVFAVVVLALYFRSTPAAHSLARFALALIFSGAVGNFIDRLRLGYVIDWIYVHWRIFGWEYHFPNFNWADSCITVGVSLLLFDMLILEGSRRKIELNPATT